GRCQMKHSVRWSASWTALPPPTWAGSIIGNSIRSARRSRPTDPLERPVVPSGARDGPGRHRTTSAGAGARATSAAAAITASAATTPATASAVAASAVATTTVTAAVVAAIAAVIAAVVAPVVSAVAGAAVVVVVVVAVVIAYVHIIGGEHGAVPGSPD